MSENKIQPYLVPLSIIVAGAFIAGGIYLSGGISGAGQTAQVGDIQQAKLPTVRKVEASRDHIRGDINAKIVIVEYSDLQCPFCSQFHATMKQVIDKYGANKQVAWVYRNFPLSSIHPEARPAAIAAECVAKLKGNDTFWNFADAIFLDQNNIGSAMFTKLAQTAGISADDFNKCIADPDIAKIIADEEQEISAQGAQGTPFSVVFKDKKAIGVIPGALPYAQVEVAIEQAINPGKTPAAPQVQPTN